MSFREAAIEIAAMAVLAVIIAVLGPFGTYAAPFGLRLMVWLVFMLAGYGLFRPVIGAGDIVAQHSPLPRWLAIGLACVLAAMPMTVLVAWCLDRLDHSGLGMNALLDRFPQVVVLGGVVTGVQLALGAAYRRRTAQQAPEAAPPEPTDAPVAAASDAVEGPVEPAGPRLAQRLPKTLSGDILALSHEDHYVRVHTAHGSALLLMRLSDAAAELDGVVGARTHRSWWVARSAVTGVERRDRAVFLKLRNGLEAPVARSSVAELKAQGWF